MTRWVTYEDAIFGTRRELVLSDGTSATAYTRPNGKAHAHAYYAGRYVSCNARSIDAACKALERALG